MLVLEGSMGMCQTKGWVHQAKRSGFAKSPGMKWLRVISGELGWDAGPELA